MSGQPGSADNTTAGPSLPGGGGPAPGAAAVVAVAGRARAAGAAGAWLRQQRQARSWNVPEMASRLRAAAAAIGHALPGRATLEAHIRRWERGVVAPSERYKLLYCRAFGITAGQYWHPGHMPPPAPLVLAAAGQAAQRCGPAAPSAALDQTGPPPGAWCPAALAHQIAEAIVTGVACHCGHGHAAPIGYPGAGAAVNGAASADTVRQLIAEAAYTRGADVAAIARVVGMTAAEVRGVLRSAGVGA